MSAEPCTDGCANCQRLQEEAQQLRAALVLAEQHIIRRNKAMPVFARTRPPIAPQDEQG